MVKKWKKEELKCNLWLNSTGSVNISATFEFISHMQLDRYDFLSPFLISCKIPEEFKNQVPLSVSLTGKEACGEPSNNLRFV